MKAHFTAVTASLLLLICSARLFCVEGNDNDFTAIQNSAPTTGIFVAPNGRPGNSGSKGSPMDLATALAPRSPVRPGDTIWLRGGVYRGAFESAINGSAGAPITVRAYP